MYGNKWSKCNSICNGTQYMNPVCVELATNSEQSDSYCSEFDKKHRTQKRDCNVHCQLRWTDVSRGPCSVNCGEGYSPTPVVLRYYLCVSGCEPSTTSA